MLYLLAISVIACNKSVALAINSRISTSSNGIHFPVGVVIVHHMEVPQSTSANVIHIFVFFGISAMAHKSNCKLRLLTFCINTFNIANKLKNTIIELLSHV